MRPRELHHGAEDGATLIDLFLREQRDLPAVSRFAQWHENGSRPALEAHYRKLIPFSKPAPGQQYAFEVNLDRCSGCKACVTACHALNGLDATESWRGVGVLVENAEPAAAALAWTVTTACHHCADPGCLNGCPVLAYDKDPVTGIVRHLDDQCIGCQYCVLMCPYEVPQYSKARGIVRKCDMCRQRLDDQEAPACVQACPNEAIRITLVGLEETRHRYRGDRPLAEREADFLPTAPDPALTLPTTRYVSKRPPDRGVHAGDAYAAPLAHGHPALVWMLVWTQWGAGGWLVVPWLAPPAQPLAAVLSAVALAVGLAGGGLHLGRPLKAWRAFLGVRRSWLSREIAVFGLLTPLAAATAWMCWRHPTAPGLLALQGACGLLSVAGVYCSGMIYHATGRACWIGRRSVGRFFATTLALGLAFAWMIGALAGESSSVPAVVLMAVTLARGCWERAGLVGRGDGARITALRSDTVRARAGFLLRFRLAAWRRGRWACAWIGGAALPGLTLLSSPTGSDAVWAAIGFLLCLAGEGIERSLFFRTAVAPKMPGGVAA